MTKGSARGFPWFTGVVVVACAALAVLVVVLSRQNRELKAALVAADNAARRVEEALKPGARLASISVVDSAGAESMVSLDGSGGRLLLIGSKQCPACESVRPMWQELGAWAASANVETICLLTDGEPGAGEAELLRMPVFGIRRFRESSISKLPTVPVVLLLRDGVVERVWPGPYEVAVRDEIMGAVKP
jgi:hypothetical protein